MERRVLKWDVQVMSTVDRFDGQEEDEQVCNEGQDAIGGQNEEINASQAGCHNDGTCTATKTLTER